MNNNDINDTRSKQDFKVITFSEFKKTAVKKELLQSLTDSKIEPACYWSAELICSGSYSELWEIILLFYGKHIQLGNPKLSIFINIKMASFKEIIKNYDCSLKLRNLDKIRIMFCEIICLLCFSKRKHSFDEIKIKHEEFDMICLKERLKAPNVKYCEPFFLDDDPKEMFIPLNEFAYHISEEGKNIIHACYWVEWIMKLDNFLKSKRENCVCEYRSLADVDPKYKKEVIWIVWEALILEASKPNYKPIILKIIKSLLSLYASNYSQGTFKKNKYLLYFAISVLTEHINLDIEIAKKDEKEKTIQIVEKINLIYKQIKVNEQSSNQDYLYSNLKQINLEKTIEKLEKMETFGETFVPRITEDDD
jgi:hypothetical protein